MQNFLELLCRFMRILSLQIDTSPTQSANPAENRPRRVIQKPNALRVHFQFYLHVLILLCILVFLVHEVVKCYWVHESNKVHFKSKLPFCSLWFGHFNGFAPNL
ncbi:hypothetical protein Hanom_Chr00s021907g01761141 [Helianthus anomalus]